MKLRLKSHPTAKSRRYSSVMIVVLAVGIAGAVLAGTNAALINRQLLISRAQTAATALSDDEISSLEGNETDLDTNAYKVLKDRMVRIRQDNEGTRFAYLLGERSSNDVFFLVDSEPASSADYSPPGMDYPDATTRLKAAFSDDTPFVEGPVSDSYGSWVSALAPVVDKNGRTIALLGIDVEARDYYMQIGMYAVIPLLLAAIPLTVLYRNRKVEEKEREITSLKTQFVTVASHELRSPLNGVLWGTQSLIAPGKNTNLTEQQQLTLTSIYNSTASSLATVNEILDFSIFNRDKTAKTQREPVDLRDVLADTKKMLDLSSQEGSVTINHVGDWPATVMTSGDPSALKRGFNNILSNAIKYSPRGSTVDVSYERQGDQHVVSVRDHGIGIPESEQTKVLEGYYRAGNATKVKAHGTGMGLWITKKIIEQHKGTLKLTSKENEGTTVTISLPAAEQTQPNQQPEGSGQQ